jgi:shikimate dehydrogenase
MNKFVVMGSPIEHSLSPDIHKLFAKQFSIELEYTKQEVTKGEFYKSLMTFFKEGGRGINLTSPLKEVAIKYIDRLSNRAYQAQSVNTLYVEDNLIIGDNTDGIGFIRSLNTDLNNKNILILGAGGALKGILLDIIALEPSNIHIANRTVNKVSKLSELYNNITISSYADIFQQDFDIVINSTSILCDHSNIFDQLNISAENYIDLQYNKNSGFYHWCLRKRIANYNSGLAMLVEQAAEGFSVWHGVFPDTSVVIDRLQKEQICKIN